MYYTLLATCFFFTECNKDDKATFVSNLVRIFRTEYNREQYTALMRSKLPIQNYNIILFIIVYTYCNYKSDDRRLL